MLCLACHVSADPLHVLICLDGVPYSLMEEYVVAGGFSRFKPPARMISTFPAITDVMLTELYGVAYPTSYGLRYYDKEANAPRGGISHPEEVRVWFDLYDYITPMIMRGMTFLWSRSALHDLNRLDRFLSRAESGILLIHLDASDALMHQHGTLPTRSWLGRVDRIVADWIDSRRDSDFEIVLFSDHGNDQTKARRVDVEQRLRRNGLHPCSTISVESDVALLPTGLITAGYLYTKHKSEVVDALIGLDGLDLALYESGGVVHVMGARGRADILRSASRDRFSYQPIQGDPLQLMNTVKSLRAAGKIDSEGYAADADWFHATLTHRYPDVLNRAYGGATSHVRQVADVLLSFDNGSEWGSEILTRMFTFKGSHGSLTRESITGFVMSNRRTLPPLRAENILDELGWREEVQARMTRNHISYRDGIMPQ